MTGQRANLFEQSLELPVGGEVNTEAVRRQRLQASLNRRRPLSGPHLGWVNGDCTRGRDIRAFNRDREAVIRAFN